MRTEYDRTMARIEGALEKKSRGGKDAALLAAVAMLKAQRRELIDAETALVEYAIREDDAENLPNAELADACARIDELNLALAKANEENTRLTYRLQGVQTDLFNVRNSLTMATVPLATHGNLREEHVRTLHANERLHEQLRKAARLKATHRRHIRTLQAKLTAMQGLWLYQRGQRQHFEREVRGYRQRDAMSLEMRRAAIAGYMKHTKQPRIA
jgi:hypothetical protein